MNNLILTVIAGLSFFICCETPKLQNSWSIFPKSIDGQCYDWDFLQYCSPARTFFTGVSNDSTFFYLCFKTRDRQFSENIMHNGFTLKFIHNGSTSKYFALKTVPEKPQHPSLQNTDHNVIPETPPPGFLSRIVVFDSKKSTGYPMAPSAARTLGIETGSSIDKEYFCCEIKIPLQPDSIHPFAINSNFTNSIQVIFETNNDAPDNRNAHNSPPNHPMGGDMAQRGAMPPQGAGGHFGGGHGGHQPPVMPGNCFEPFSFTFTVLLATK